MTNCLYNASYDLFIVVRKFSILSLEGQYVSSNKPVNSHLNDDIKYDASLIKFFVQRKLNQSISQHHILSRLLKQPNDAPLRNSNHLFHFRFDAYIPITDIYLRENDVVASAVC